MLSRYNSIDKLPLECNIALKDADYFLHPSDVNISMVATAIPNFSGYCVKACFPIQWDEYQKLYGLSIRPVSITIRSSLMGLEYLIPLIKCSLSKDEVADIIKQTTKANHKLIVKGYLLSHAFNDKTYPLEVETVMIRNTPMISSVSFAITKAEADAFVAHWIDRSLLANPTLMLIK